MIKKIFIFITIMNAFTLFPAENDITIDKIISLTLQNDPRIKLYTEYVHEKHNLYKSAAAGNLPQLKTSIGYSPYSRYVSTTDTGTIYAYTYAAHGIPYSISLSQLLPTGGMLDIKASNTTAFSTTTQINTNTHSETEYFDLYQNPNLSLSYTQPVFINNKIIDFNLFPASLQQTKLIYLISLVQLEHIRNISIHNALSLFFLLQELKKTLALQKQWLEWENKKLENLNRSFELNMVTDTDVWEMRVNIGDRQETILDLEHQLVKSEKNFTYSLGLENMDNIYFNNSIPEFDFTLSKTELVEKTISNNPQIMEYFYMYEHAHLASILYENNDPPHISLSFTLSPYYPDTRKNSDDFFSSIGDFFSDEAGIDWSLSLNFVCPIYDGGKKNHGKNAFKASEQAAQEQYAFQVKNIQILCETLYLNTSHIKKKIGLAMDHVELNRKKVDIEKKKREHKQATSLDVKEAELILQEYENKLWRLQADYFLAACELYSYTGVSISEEIKTEP